MSATQLRGLEDVQFQDRQHLDADLCDLGQCLKIDGEFGNLRMVLAKAGGQARCRLTQPVHRFRRHEAVDNVGQDVGRDEAAEFLKLDALQQEREGRPHFGSEVKW